jgi:hypothetical protein
MHRRFVAGLTAFLAAAGAFMVLSASPASAHQERTVGRYHLAVGFGDEPAYAGQQNSVQLFLHDANDRPVTDLGDTLRVQVVYGNRHLDLVMQPFFEVGEFGTPGDYRAWFFPTRPGHYTFHFTGTIGKQAIDQSFTSGPQTFADVQEPTAVEFPVRDPTAGQVAQRLEREVPRLQAALAAAGRTARDQASSAHTLALIGLVVGGLGLLVACVAVVWARRTVAAPASRPAPAVAQGERTG